MKKIFHHILVYIINFSLIYSSFASDLVVPLPNDNGAKPDLTFTSKDMPVVNIVDPSPDGLSYNKFEKYNTDEKGIVVNNSKKDLDLGEKNGILYRNGKLLNEAEAILFDIDGSSNTILKGDNIVAGKNAEFIISNRNGIECKGCNFINTKKATLSTENLRDPSEAIKGKILLEDIGATGDVYAKSGKVELSGTPSVKGKITVQATGNGLNEEEFAVDGEKLTAMYANQINIISDKAGNSVRVRGTMISGSDLNINSAGYADLAHSALHGDNVDIFAKENISLDNGKVEAKNKARVYGKNINAVRLELTAKNGSIVAKEGGIDASGSNIEYTENADIQAKALKNTEGRIAIGGNLKLDVGELDNRVGIIKVGNKLTMNADSVFNDLGMISARIIFAQVLGNTNNRMGQILASESIYYNNFGDFYNQGGDILAGLSVHLFTNNFYNLLAKDVKSSNVTASKVFISANNELINEGNIIGSESLEINAKKVDNTGMMLTDKGKFVVDHFRNAGSVSGFDSVISVLDFKTTVLENLGKIINANVLKIVTDEFVNKSIIDNIVNASISMKKYIREGTIRVKKYLAIGDFREDGDNYYVNKDTDLEFEFRGDSNEQVENGGIINYFAKSLKNYNKKTSFNHHLKFDLAGNTFTNYGIMEFFNSNFSINDPTGNFYNAGKIMVYGGDFFVNSKQITSKRYDPLSTVDFRSYDASSPYFYDIYVSSIGGVGGNIDMESATTANFIGTKIYADQTAYISSAGDLIAKYYFNQQDYARGPNQLMDYFYINAGGNIHMNSTGGKVVLHGGAANSANGNIYINSKGRAEIKSFSKFYLRSDLGPANYYWAEHRPLYACGSSHACDDEDGPYADTGTPTAVNFKTNLNAANGNIYITSTNDEIYTEGAQFNSQKFYAQSQKSTILNGKEFYNLTIEPYQWGFDMGGTEINTVSDLVIDSNDKIFSYGTQVSSMGGIGQVYLYAKEKVDVENFKVHFIDRGGYNDWGQDKDKVLPGAIIADKPVIIKSENSSVTIKGSSISSTDKIYLYAKDAVNLISDYVSWKNTSEYKKKKWYGSQKVTTTTTETEVYPTQIIGAQGVEVDAELYYEKGATVLVPEGKYKINAKKHILDALEIESETTTEVKTTGLMTSSSIFDNVVMGGLNETGAGKSKITIYDTSPFLRELNNALGIKSATDLAPAINFGIATINLLKTFTGRYKETGSAKEASLTSMLEQLGGAQYATDNKGGYIVGLAGVGMSSTKYTTTSRSTTNMTSNTYAHEYEENTEHIINNGGHVSIDKGSVAANKLDMNAVTNTTDNTTSLTKGSFMIGKGGVSFKKNQQDTIEHIEEKVYSMYVGNELLVFNIGEESDISGGIITTSEGGKVIFDAPKVAIETLNDIYHNKNSSTSVGVGVSWDLKPNFDYGRSWGGKTIERANQIAGIYGEHVVFNAGEVELKGGIIGGTNTSEVNIAKLVASEVKEKYESKQTSFNISTDGQFSENSSKLKDIASWGKSLFQKQAGYSKSHKVEEGIIKPTILGKNSYGVNNDLATIEEWNKVKNETYSGTVVDVFSKESREDLKRTFETMGQVARDIGRRIGDKEYGDGEHAGVDVVNIIKMVNEETKKIGFDEKQQQEVIDMFLSEYKKLEEASNGDIGVANRAFAKSLWEFSDTFYLLQNAENIKTAYGEKAKAGIEQIEDSIVKADQGNAYDQEVSLPVKVAAEATNKALIAAMKNPAIRNWLISQATKHGLVYVINKINESTLKESFQNYDLILANHESGSHKGHTLEKHVAKPEQWLVDRLNRPDQQHVNASSSFFDEQIAEKAIKDALQDNKFITKFSNKSIGDIFDVKDIDVGYEVGYGILRQDLNSNVFSNTTRLSIKIQKTGNNNFVIITAYPEMRSK